MVIGTSAIEKQGTDADDYYTCSTLGVSSKSTATLASNKRGPSPVTRHPVV